MKKLVCLFGLIFTCSSIYASQVSWGAMSVRNDGTAMTNFMAMAFFVETGTDMSTTWEQIAAGVDPSTLQGATTAYTSTSPIGNIPTQTVATFDNHWILSPSTSYDVYLVVFDGNQFAYVGNSENPITTPAWVETNEQYVSVNFGVVNFTSSSWHKTVPEPTALALLALGVAGVALRRRIR